MQSPPSSPTEMSYTKLVKLAPLTSTPATNQAKPAMPRTAPPATIHVYERVRSNATPSALPSSTPASAPRAESTHFNQAESTTVEERLSNLATKLGQSKSSIDRQSNAQTQPSNSKMVEVHQFIDILKNMQNVVSNTADEQQRTKKARALNTLLTMFESIIDERSNIQQTANPSMQHLEWRIQFLEIENERLQSRCNDSEATMQHRNQEMTLLQQDIQRVARENDQLRKELAQAQEQCRQEYSRAQEAEQVASESEKVRNGLLSSYGRLTEENVDLQRAMEDVDSEKKVLSKALASIREEVDALRNQSNQLHKQLRDSSKEKKELETLLDIANVQLEKQRNAISAANEDRQRIQDELHRSQRNSTATSEQLLKLRDEFTRKLQVDRNSKAHESLVSQLEEEQTRRRELEQLVSTAKGKEGSAEEWMRKLAKSNAELRSQVNQMCARISIAEECSKEEAHDSSELSKESDNLSCYF